MSATLVRDKRQAATEDEDHRDKERLPGGRFGCQWKPTSPHWLGTGHHTAVSGVNQSRVAAGAQIDKTIDIRRWVALTRLPLLQRAGVTMMSPSSPSVPPKASRCSLSGLLTQVAELLSFSERFKEELGGVPTCPRIFNIYSICKDKRPGWQRRLPTAVGAWALPRSQSTAPTATGRWPSPRMLSSSD